MAQGNARRGMRMEWCITADEKVRLNNLTKRGRRSGRRFGQRLCVDGADPSSGFVASAAATGEVRGAVLPSSAGGDRVGVCPWRVGEREIRGSEPQTSAVV